MKAIAVAGCVLTLLVLSGRAESHVLPRPAKHMTVAQRHTFQLHALHHARTAVTFLERRPRLRATRVGRRELAFHRAMARWTRRELRQTFSALDRLLIPHKPQWLCIHDHEGDWEDGGDPHWGGLQMDQSFMRTYGADFLRRHGAPRGHSGPNGWANPWTPREQMIAAERAHRTRGFHPWPNTARACGLL